MTYRPACFAAARSRCLALLLVFVSAGCSEPELTPLEQARERRRQLDEAEAAARARREELLRRELGGDRPPPRMGLESGAGAGVEEGPTKKPESQAAIKRRLLAKHGARLTAMQRSALQTARVGSYEEGEAMCLRWIGENERFEKGTGR